MNLANWVQILDKAIIIWHNAYNSGKGMNPIILSPVMNEYVDRLGLLTWYVNRRRKTLNSNLLNAA